MTEKFVSEFSEEFKQQAKQYAGYDFSLEGKRIKLIHTNDPYTDLRPGDYGTIRFQSYNYDCFVIDVRWDSGSNLGLISGKDRYEIIDTEKRDKDLRDKTTKCDCNLDGSLMRESFACIDSGLGGKSGICKNCLRSLYAINLEDGNYPQTEYDTLRRIELEGLN